MPHRRIPVKHIEDREALERYVSHLYEAKRFGFDTEFISERSYRPRICLIQVATEQEFGVIDPLRVDDLTPFWEAVLNPENEVITHAGESDFLICHQQTGRVPCSGFDTQLAAGFVGYGYPCGYATLVNNVLGVRLRKHETLTDWSRRPLRPEQTRYAVDDVRYLLPLYTHLREELELRGRMSWVNEEFSRIEEGAVRTVEPGEAYRRIKGISALDSQEMAVLGEVAEWRERRARERDRPVRTILQDYILIEIARRQPESESELRSIRGLHGQTLKHSVPEILDAVRRGQEVLPEDRPRLLRRPAFPGSLRPVVDIAAAVLRQRAAELEIAPELMATRADLERFCEVLFREPDQVRKDDLYEGWRGECVGPLLEKLMTGGIGIRLHIEDGTPRLEVEGI